MKRKTMALFMLVTMISAGTLFAGRANARNNFTLENAPNGVMTQAVNFSASSAAVSANYNSGLALVTFQNYTPWTIQCYVDGNFVGLVYPGRTLSSWTGSGWTRPYARAVFVDGSSLSWDLGNVFYLPGGSYLFPMYR